MFSRVQACLSCLGRLVAALGLAGTLAEILLSVKAYFPIGKLAQELRVTPEGSE